MPLSLVLFLALVEGEIGNKERATENGACQKSSFYHVYAVFTTALVRASTSS